MNPLVGLGYIFSIFSRRAFPSPFYLPWIDWQHQAFSMSFQHSSPLHKREAEGDERKYPTIINTSIIVRSSIDWRHVIPCWELDAWLIMSKVPKKIRNEQENIGFSFWQNISVVSIKIITRKFGFLLLWRHMFVHRVKKRRRSLLRLIDRDFILKKWSRKFPLILFFSLSTNFIYCGERSNESFLL